MKNFRKCSDRNREIPPPTTPAIFGHPGGWHAPSVSSAVARGRRGGARPSRAAFAAPDGHTHVSACPQCHPQPLGPPGRP